MTPDELAELLRRGEDSTLEFKRDDVQNHDLARELVALLNLAGGTVLLGVDDSGAIVGSTRDALEEWVAELCRVKIEPPVVPLMSWVRDAEPGRDVLVVQLSAGPDKPYARLHNGLRSYYIRVGSTSREASREELERLFQASGRLNYGLKPVPGADWSAFDPRRLRDYFTRVLQGDAPEDTEHGGWEDLLTNVNLMTESIGQCTATIDGLLLFGSRPQRFLPQSGIRAICYTGANRDYSTRADEDIRGPMVFLGSANGELTETGLVERTLDFVRRNTETTAVLDGGRRIDCREYPEAVIRELVVNALVHRDYSIAGADILLEIFTDRLEVTSPGKLPNTVTPEGMRCGLRYARNQTLVNVMRDYAYRESRGMSESKRAERAPWNDFPPVIRNGDLKELEKEPAYQAAKSGDWGAALAMAERLVRPETVDAIRVMVGDQPARIVPVVAQESAGDNKIPLAAAEVLGDRLGLEVEYNIVQAEKVGRTNKGADHRLAMNPSFDGEVERGQPYVLVDDTLTMGGTIASLRGYIENRGGQVLGAAVMTAHPGALDMAIKPKMLADIERKHGQAMNDYWRKEFGYPIEQLTQGEAGHLRAAPTVDAIRDRIAAARDSAGWTVDERTTGEAAAESPGVKRGPHQEKFEAFCNPPEK